MFFLDDSYDMYGICISLCIHIQYIYNILYYTYNIYLRLLKSFRMPFLAIYIYTYIYIYYDFNMFFFCDLQICVVFLWMGT